MTKSEAYANFKALDAAWFALVVELFGDEKIATQLQSTGYARGEGYADPQFGAKIHKAFADRRAAHEAFLAIANPAPVAA